MRGCEEVQLSNYDCKTCICFGNECMNECENCGRSLEGGSFTLPWEEDDNMYAYIICPYCRHKSTIYEDED